MTSREAPGADRWVPDRPTLRKLDSAVQDCRGCELYRDATQAVMGRGDTGAGLMLLGEQPGDREDIEGEPFVGPAGGVLDKALAEAGIAPDSVYTTNVVKHFRFRTVGKRRIHLSPTRGQVTACAPWLAAELEVVRPAGVVLLGGTAGKALYGSSFRVGKARGKVVGWPEDLPSTDPAPWVLATIHPSAVLRAEDDRQEAYDGLVADLRTAAAELKS
ncbi:UdgX family uracil-DNA binding protein [Nocardioides sp. KR10-350]|uniref:UdgX family uracil-DNA binding protein n=1 Tax=Nocardioides cheoyonin TaxID=3156615 RepID=UPI0032B5F82B